jgi:hypothetical protein
MSGDLQDVIAGRNVPELETAVALDARAERHWSNDAGTAAGRQHDPAADRFTRRVKCPPGDARRRRADEREIDAGELLRSADGDQLRFSRIRSAGEVPYRNCIMVRATAEHDHKPYGSGLVSTLRPERFGTSSCFICSASSHRPLDTTPINRGVFPSFGSDDIDAGRITYLIASAANWNTQECHVRRHSRVFARSDRHESWEWLYMTIAPSQCPKCKSRRTRVTGTLPTPPATIVLCEACGHVTMVPGDSAT